MTYYDKIGKEGEQWYLNYARKHYETVSNKTQDSDFWFKDIDYLCYDKNMNETKIEVKTDTSIQYTGNIFAETVKNKWKDEKGWLFYCQADFIVYHPYKTNIGYQFALDDLKEYIARNQSHLQERECKDRAKDGTTKKISKGYLVPLEDFRKHYKVETIQL